MESILTSIKKLLGITEECEDFDPDIIIGINSSFDILEQMGVGPKGGFFITDKSATWTDFMQNLPVNSEMIKTYVYMKTKLMFDPPTTSFVLESMNKTIEEMEFRLNVKYDSREPKNENI